MGMKTGISADSDLQQSQREHVVLEGWPVCVPLSSALHTDPRPSIAKVQGRASWSSALIKEAPWLSCCASREGLNWMDLKKKTQMLEEKNPKWGYCQAQWCTPSIPATLELTEDHEFEASLEDSQERTTKERKRKEKNNTVGLF